MWSGSTVSGLKLWPSKLSFCHFLAQHGGALATREISWHSRQRLRSQNPNFNMHDIHRWVLEVLKCKTKMTFNLYWLQKCHILSCSNGAVHQRRAWQNERCLHLHDLTIHSSKCNFTFLFNLHKRTSWHGQGLHVNQHSSQFIEDLFQHQFPRVKVGK